MQVMWLYCWWKIRFNIAPISSLASSNTHLQHNVPLPWMKLSHYNSKGSDVFVIFLDATKAFDPIDFCRLFRKLLDRNMPPLLLRLLLYMYTNQNLQVQWCFIAGTKFATCNGVKQGAVVSPILFAIYMDDLFLQLKDSGGGCHIGNHYVGSLGYADDTVLMAPSLKGLQTIVNVSVNNARKHDVIYNGSKSQFLIFVSNLGSHVKHISIDGNVLQNVNEADHLGHWVSVINNDCMLQHALSQFWHSFNIFRVDFGRLYPQIQFDLFIAYCSSFYGAPLKNNSSATFKQLCAAWRKCLRKIWQVHPMTHCDVIALLSHCKPMEIGIQQRFCKFVSNIFQNDTITATTQAMVPTKPYIQLGYIMMERTWQPLRQWSNMFNLTDNQQDTNYIWSSYPGKYAAVNNRLEQTR